MFNALKTLNLQKVFNLGKVERQIIILISVILLFLANLLISPLSLRLDLSKGKAYTLSPSTKKILKNANDLVDIKFFVSSDIPTKLLPLKTEVTDLLNEYKRQSNHVRVSVLDPKKDPKIAADAKDSGVPEMQFSQLESDKYAVTASTFGLAVQYGGKKEVIPQATNISNLEYSLTAAIYRLTRKELPQIGIVGEDQSLNVQSDPIATLRQVLQQQLTVTDSDIGSKINSSVKTLLVFDNNRKEYSADEVKNLKEYINSKGKVIFLADGVWVPSDLSSAPLDAKHNLFNLIKDYGLVVNKNLILSDSSELVNFGNDVVSFVSPYPYWVKTSITGFQSGNFANINHLTLPWVSSISLGKKSGYTVEGIVNTVKQSWEQKKDFTLFPQNIKQPQSNQFKQFTLAAQSMKKDGGGIVVIPTSRFVNEEFVRRGNDNMEFLLNLIDNLASGGALSGIRNREIVSYPLPTFSSTQQDIFKYTTMLLLPILFAFYGTWRIVRRK